MVISPLEAPWREGEIDRYEPCERHRGPLSRMDYDDAWDYAAKCCADCRAGVRS